jgi:tetratricopeptide (TPR) repeat protein
LDPDQKDDLRTYLSGLDADQPLGLIVPIFNVVDSVHSGKFIESSAVRVFTNLPTVFFDRPIHEQVVYEHGELPMRNYTLSIFHTGYLEQTRREKEKSARNLSIFDELKHLEEYDYFTLGNEYSAKKDYKKALYYYERALTKKTEHMSFYPYCRYQIVLVLLDLGRYQDAWKNIEENLKRWPQYPDYYTLKGTIYEVLGFEEEAAELYSTALSKAENPVGKDQRYWLISPSLGGYQPLHNLSRIYEKAHDFPKAVYYLSKLVNMNPNDHLSLFRLLSLLSGRESPESIQDLLGKWFDCEKPDHLLKLLHVCLLLGHKELSQYYYERCVRQNVELPVSQQLLHAVVFNNRDAFMRLLPQTGNRHRSGQINKLLFLAGIIWKNTELGTYLSETGDEKDPPPDMLASMYQLVFDPASAQENAPFDVNFIATLLIDLFKMGYYEEYDWLIQQFPDYYFVLANLMGDYFWQCHQMELALDYYSLLLEQEQLSGPGYYHLALMHFQSGETTDGLKFLAKAIDIHPHQHAWYVQYFKRCPNTSERKSMLSRYRNEFSRYSQIDVVQKMMKDLA